jgi:hypothetical protein
MSETTFGIGGAPRGRAELTATASPALADQITVVGDGSTAPTDFAPTDLQLYSIAQQGNDRGPVSGAFQAYATGTHGNVALLESQGAYSLFAGCVVRPVTDAEVPAANEREAFYTGAIADSTLSDASAVAILAQSSLLVDGGFSDEGFFNPLTIASGFVSLSPTQWSLATFEGTTLTAGAVYYLSDQIRGQITKTAPTTPGHYAVKIGRAASATQFVVQIGEPQLIPNS